MQEPIDRYFAANGFEPKVAMRFDSSEFIRSMVHTGLGIALLPYWIAQRDLKERRLSMIRPAEATPFPKIALIRRKSNFVPRPVQGFIQTATALVARDVPLLTSSGIRRPLDSRQSKRVER